MNAILREFFSEEFQRRHREHYMSVPHVSGWRLLETEPGTIARVKAAFIEEPPSPMIVEWLNVLAARTCPHERNPCYLRCGVRGINGFWEIIPPWERERWLHPNRATTLLEAVR